MNLNRFCVCLLLFSAAGSFCFPHPVWAWGLLINGITLLIYGADKFAARKSWQRVPEKTLLLFGLVGGWIGAVFAQQLFRHKTQKQPFKTWFMVSVVLNVLVVAGIGYWKATMI